MVSCAAIGYEILLMRLLSIVQWHHFAYMIISLALLGYGASGTAIALSRHWIVEHFELAFALSASLFSVSMVASFIAGQLVPFNALEIVWNPRQFLYLAAIYLIFFVPFFFAASCIGIAFTCRCNHSNRIYFFDLCGAGAGAMLVLGALFVLMPPHTLLLLATLAMAGAIVMSGRRWLAAIQSILLLGLLIGLPADWLGLRLSAYKGLSETMQIIDARALNVYSSPLGLLTVVESPTVPFRHAPGLSFATRFVPPEQLAVFTDGDAMSVISRVDGDVAQLGYLGDVTAALPYSLLSSPRVLVLGAGGGSDVLLALFHGAAQVDAVELNPQMNALVGVEYADFAGRLYDDPRISVFSHEARGFVAQSEGGYDLIHIGLLDSFAVAGSGVQGLNESYLYTVEALSEYLGKLSDGGILSITRWLRLPPRDSLKLAATVIDAMRTSGVNDPEQRLAVIRSWNTSTLIAKNGRLSDAEIARLVQFADARSFDTAYFPGIQLDDANRFNIIPDPWLHEGIVALLGANAEDFKRDYRFYIEPATDSRPYFFHLFKWGSLPQLMSLGRQGAAGLVDWGYLVLVATVVQAAIIGFLMILLPLLKSNRRGPSLTGRRGGTYFFLLGLAFLFVEMAFIQKFTLFLSHPLYSVAVVLSGFLVFAGIGSVVSGRWRTAATEGSRRAVIGIVSIALLYILILPLVFQFFMGWPDPAKIAMSLALIAPLAFFMGVPFPLGLQAARDVAPEFVPWAWGINGFASVLSASLATLLAVELGFSGVVLLALLLYVAATRFFPAPARSRSGVD
ncbi:MAG: SAM-dependent methyltransferase [Gammaproteobacteria bacterium]|nr:SAM-dependent methyltransferase [Gammaproteobacteria bacterium]